MKKLLYLADDLKTQFIFQNRPIGEPIVQEVLPDPEAVDEPLDSQEALEQALWAAARNPEGVEEAEALEALIEAQVTQLFVADEAGDQRAIITPEALTRFLDENYDAPLGADEIGEIAEAVEDRVDTEEEGEPLTPEEQTEMQGMSNQEFLQKTPEARLRFVTKNNIEASAVASGSVESLEFSFTFDGQYNEELWYKTTAGQVLPPEVRTVTVGGNQFSREADSLTGEFFAVNGERLTIHEGTSLTNIETGDLAEIQALIDTKMEAYNEAEEGEKLLARAALEKGIDPAFAMATFRKDGDEVETQVAPHRTSDEARLGIERVELTTEYAANYESFLTNIDRAKDAFRDVSQQENEDSTEYFTEVDGKVTPEFASFYMGFDNQTEARRVEVMESAGYDAAQIAASQNWVDRAQERSVNHGSGGEMVDVSADELQGVLENEDPAQLEAMFENIRSYPPGSEIAQKLFAYAAMKANMGLSTAEAMEWGTSPDLHYILGRESNGEVGSLNYTLRERGVSLAQLKSGDQGGARSSASGLGQCLYVNVNKYYPDGREGIGDPLNEAVGMLRYIRDRYGSPQAARSVYGRTGTFVHGVSGRVQTKSFREGY